MTCNEQTRYHQDNAAELRELTRLGVTTPQEARVATRILNDPDNAPDYQYMRVSERVDLALSLARLT